MSISKPIITLGVDKTENVTFVTTATASSNFITDSQEEEANAKRIESSSNEKLLMTLLELILSSEVSVRLENCIKVAFIDGTSPFITVGDYLSAGDSAIIRMLKLQNFGRKTAHELDTLVKQATEDIKFDVAEDIDSDEDAPCPQTVLPFAWNGVELDESILDSSLLVVMNSRVVQHRLKNCVALNYDSDDFPFKTIRDVLVDDGRGVKALLRFDNFGRKSADDLKSFVEGFLDDQTRDNGRLSSECRRTKNVAEVIDDLMFLCSRNEVEIVNLRYGLNGYDTHTLEAISVLFGVTRERIRQIEKKALNKLRLSTYQSQVAEALNGDEDRFFEILSLGRSYILSSELARIQIPGEYALAFDVIGVSTYFFLSSISQKFERGWLRHEIPLEEMLSFRKELENALVGRQFPIPLELLDIVYNNYSHIPIEISVPEGLTIIDSLIFDGRIGRRKRRQAHLYRILLSGYQQLDSLTAEHNTQFPLETCSCRDALIVMEFAPHLFLSLGDQGWAAIGKKTSIKFFTRDDSDVIEDSGTDLDTNASYLNDVTTISELLRKILTEHGPMHFVDLREVMLSVSDNSYSKASLGPILILNDDFIRVAPGVYGLRDHFEDIEPAINYGHILLKDMDCQLYAVARRAGEKMHSFPMWTPLMEYKWCKWAHANLKGRSTDIYSSLMFISNPYYWPVDQEEMDYWLEIKRKDESYALKSPHKHMLSDYLPTVREICSALMVIDRKSSLNWVCVNRILNRRVNDHHAASMMSLLIGLGALKPASHWQYPHSKGDRLEPILDLLLENLSLSGEISWSCKLGQEIITRLSNNIELDLLGWVEKDQLSALVDLLNSDSNNNYSQSTDTYASQNETLSPMDFLLSQMNQKSKELQFAEIVEELNGR